MPTVVLLRQACKGIEDCGICKFVCPKDLFTASNEMNTAGYLPPKVDHEEDCTGCCNCMMFCPDFAIVVLSEGDKGLNGRGN